MNKIDCSVDQLFTKFKIQFIILILYNIIYMGLFKEDLDFKYFNFVVLKFKMREIYSILLYFMNKSY